jgi:hypothetical protein
MMKYLGVVGILAAALAMQGTIVSAQTAPAAGTMLGTVNIPTRVMANGQVLTPGSYQVRLTTEMPQPGPGQTQESERWVEFVRGGKPVGREVASVVPAAEIAQVAEGPRPAAGGSRVEMLKGNDYLRVWINRDGVNYLIHLPLATS